MELGDKSDACMRAHMCLGVHAVFGCTAFGGDGLLQHTKQSRKGGWWILLESWKGFVMNNSHE